MLSFKTLKNTNMKLIYGAVLSGILLLAGSCKKELYKDPIGLLTPGQVNTDPTLNSVRSSVTSSYQMLSSSLNLIGEWDWTGGTVLRNDFIIHDMAAGDMQKKWNPDGDQAWMDDVSNFRFTANNGGFNGIWSYDYEGIARANLAISYLTDETIVSKIGIDAALKNRLLGEVYFLRAFYYFDLLVNFGEVPLITKPLTSFSEAYEVAKRVPKEEVRAQISSDLENAKNLFPNSKYSDEAERWRVSKGAVIAMQAKVALYNQKWQEVIDRVTELETLAFYGLNTNYFDSFNVAKEFADNEVIFAYNHVSAQTPRNGNGLCALLGWGFVAPTTDFINEFEANDPRLLYTVDKDNQAVYKILGETTTANKGNDDAPGNKIYIRWADVLLWKAEAYIESGNNRSAIEIINQVRSRARTSATINGTTAPAGTLPDRDVNVTDKNQVKAWLMHERRVELGFESHRFNDLKRWGIAKTVLTALGKNFQDKNNLYPIPQGEVDKSGGTITQNTGY
jgi:hypothetical protein